MNEQDVWTVHITRVLAKLGGLLRFRHKAFHTTRKGESLRGEARAGELLALLFRTYFRGFNIGHLRYGDAGEIQYLVPLILHRLRTAADAWTDGRSLAADVLPPELLEREGQQEGDLLASSGRLPYQYGKRRTATTASTTTVIRGTAHRGRRARCG